LNDLTKNILLWVVIVLVLLAVFWACWLRLRRVSPA